MRHPNIVDEQRNDYRGNKRNDDFPDPDQNGVPQYIQKVGVLVENNQEIVKANKMVLQAAPYPHFGVILREGDENPVHWDIAKYKVKDDRRNDHQYQVTGPGDLFAQMIEPGLPGCDKSRFH